MKGSRSALTQRAIPRGELLPGREDAEPSDAERSRILHQESRKKDTPLSFISSQVLRKREHKESTEEEMPRTSKITEVFQ